MTIAFAFNRQFRYSHCIPLTSALDRIKEFFHFWYNQKVVR